MTEVINNPCAASRARVDCTQSSSQSGYIDISLCSQSTRACARAREGLSPIRDHEAYFRAWRMAKFGGDFDPIRVAVDEAVEAFSSGKSEAGRSSDRRVWLKIANRVGLDRFLDAFDQKASEIGDLVNRGMRLRNPAASFQKLLNARFPKNPPSPRLRRTRGGAA